MAGSGGGTMTPVTSIGTGLSFAQPLPRTLLPLARYAEIMQVPIPHFQQLNGTKAPVTQGCNDAIWDQQARELLAWSVLQAEEMIAEYLNFWPSPKFITDEEIAFGLSGIKRDWWNAEIKTRWGKVECFGTETLTLLMGDAVVVYENLDSDPLGREETATITITDSTCTNACDVAIFFRVADGAETAASEDWEIRPIKVGISGGVITIRAEASLFIKPELWALTKADSAGSGDTDAWKVDYDTTNFVTQVDVYCRTVSQATPVTIRWDGTCDCVGVCEHRTQLACAHKTDKRRGSFIPRPATWNGSSNIFARATHSFRPESVTANYRAGMAFSGICRMNANMERAIVKLTNALLPEPPCGFCGDVAKRAWQDDRREIDPLTPEAASMPWDIYKRGALEAWRIVKLFSMGRGGKVGMSYR